MSVREYDDGGKRFYVISVTGYDTSVSPLDQGAVPGTTYAILDRDYMHREVAVFEPKHGSRRDLTKQRAERLAAELNEELE